jgi:hypothetical protein
MRKPNIPKTLRHAVEECSTETVRTILLHGWANPQDFPEVIKRIAQPSSERKTAMLAVEVGPFVAAMNAEGYDVLHPIDHSHRPDIYFARSAHRAPMHVR